MRDEMLQHLIIPILYANMCTDTHKNTRAGGAFM